MNGLDLGVEMPIKATRQRTKHLQSEIDRLNKENCSLTVRIEGLTSTLENTALKNNELLTRLKSISAIAGNFNA